MGLASSGFGQAQAPVGWRHDGKEREELHASGQHKEGEGPFGHMGEDGVVQAAPHGVDEG